MMLRGGAYRRNSSHSDWPSTSSMLWRGIAYHLGIDRAIGIIRLRQKARKPATNKYGEIGSRHCRGLSASKIETSISIVMRAPGGDHPNGESSFRAIPNEIYGNGPVAAGRSACTSMARSCPLSKPPKASPQHRRRRALPSSPEQTPRLK